MKKIYIVYHEYEVDGGFGDAIPEEDVVACFCDQETAEEFMNKYHNPHVYDIPYDELSCGSLSLVEEKVFESIKEAEESSDLDSYTINGAYPFNKITDEEKHLDEEEHQEWKKRRGLV